MTHIPQILVNNLTYSVPGSKKLLFKDLSLSLGLEKTGLVGRNGIGKTTFLKLMLGELAPLQGSIVRNGPLAFSAQQLEYEEQETVAEFLGVSERILALGRIKHGSIAEDDYQIVGDDWLLEENLRLQLTNFDLDRLSLDTKLSQLSGGEKTRLSLAKTFLANANFILLDEPTNNLDRTTRDFLYQKITAWQGGLLVVSHDRTLLNLMDQIIELHTKGLTLYGGNFEHYQAQKKILDEAQWHDFLNAKKELDKVKFSFQASKEKREQKKSRGRNLFLSGKIDKLTANSKRGRSERTQRRITTQAMQQLKIAEQTVQTTKAKIELNRTIAVDLQKTIVPRGKVVVNIENLYFKYAKADEAIIEDFNFQLVGPERIAVLGPNGSGKTTLLQLILGKLNPTSGNIILGVNSVRYLDQNTNTLDPHLSLLDNFMKTNVDANKTQAHHALAQFLFRNDDALKLTGELSGGERLRAELACALLATTPPQLLILDEPTNHLDLESIASIESALQEFQGALLVISHDLYFLKNIRIESAISAPFNKN